MVWSTLLLHWLDDNSSILALKTKRQGLLYDNKAHFVFFNVCCSCTKYRVFFLYTFIVRQLVWSLWKTVFSYCGILNLFSPHLLLHNVLLQYNFEDLLTCYNWQEWLQFIIAGLDSGCQELGMKFILQKLTTWGVFQERSSSFLILSKIEHIVNCRNREGLWC